MTIAHTIDAKKQLLHEINQQAVAFLQAMIDDLQTAIDPVTDSASLAELMERLDDLSLDPNADGASALSECLAGYRAAWGFTQFSVDGMGDDDSYVLSTSSSQLDQEMSQRLRDVPPIDWHFTLELGSENALQVTDFWLGTIALCDLAQLQDIQKVWHEWMARFTDTQQQTAN